MYGIFSESILLCPPPLITGVDTNNWMIQLKVAEISYRQNNEREVCYATPCITDNCKLRNYFLFTLRLEQDFSEQLDKSNS